MLATSEFPSIDLRAMADNAPVALWMSDSEGRCSYVNRRWLEFTGRPLEDELGDGWAEGIHEDDVETVLAAWKRAFNLRQIYSASYRKLRKDGVCRWLKDDGSPHFDAQGRFEGYIGVCVDETEHREALERAGRVERDLRETEAALLASEGRFESLLDAIPCSVYEVDNDGRVSYVNEHWLEYAGMTRAESQSDVSRAVIHPDELEPLLEKTRAARQAGVPHESEMRVLRHDGAYRWHLARTVPVRVNGQITGWVGTNVDIDDRKRREAVSDFLAEAGRELAQTLELDATLTKITELAVPRLADWCKIDLADENAGSRLIAYSNADPRRKALVDDARDLFGEPQDERPLDRVMRTGKSELLEYAEPLVAEFLAQRPDLKGLLAELDLKSSLVVAIKHNGPPLGALTLATAESGRRLTHDDVALAEEFAGRIALAIENAKLYGNLTAALQAKDDFLGLVSHELRTPLTTLKGTANVLRRHGDLIPVADRAQGLKDIELGAEQLARIVENMLTLAHAEKSGAAELEPQLLRRLIEALLTEQREQFAGHEVTLTASEELLPVYANASYVRHIVGNLLSNARKYSPAGAPIDVTIERDGDYAAVSVSDKGIGLKQEQLDEIFEPFFRSKEGAARASGIGLGLTVCKRFVEIQGGQISAASRPGGGSIFRFTLPLAIEVGENPEE